MLRLLLCRVPVGEMPARIIDGDDETDDGDDETDDGDDEKDDGEATMTMGSGKLTGFLRFDWLGVEIVFE